VGVGGEEGVATALEGVGVGGEEGVGVEADERVGDNADAGGLDSAAFASAFQREMEFGWTPKSLATSTSFLPAPSWRRISWRTSRLTGRPRPPLCAAPLVEADEWSGR